MQTTREQLYSAFFNFIKTTPGFASAWRRVLTGEQLQTALLPALMLRQVAEDVKIAQGPAGIPPKYVVDLDLVIAVQTPAEPLDSIPATAINALVDAIERQLTPDPVTNVVNLGLANVSRVMLAGKIEYLEAPTSGTDMSWVGIPIAIICT